MAEGSAEEEQSSTAAPASPPADLRTLNTQLSPPYHHQPHLQPPRLQHLQHPNMLATAVPPRHSHSMLSHQVKTEAELDAAYDVPLNLKSEESDRSSAGSPEPATGAMHEHQIMMDDIKNSRKRRRTPSPENLHQAKRAGVPSQAHLNGTMAAMVTLQNLHNLENLQSLESPESATGSLHEHQIMMDDVKNSRKRRRSPSPDDLHQAKCAAVARAHLNGTMADMMTLQNLHNLANLQNLPQVASLAASLQGMTAGLNNNQLINTPLNLTVSSSGGTASTASSTTAAPHLLPPSPAPMVTLPQLLSQPQSVAMPQFILMSGQLVQGIQGAQLLIPTSQGIATQTILTIPVNHVTNNQMVNLALTNGQVVSTTLANLQSIAQPQNMLNTPTSNVPTSPSLASGLGLNPATLPHLLSNSSASQQLLNAMQPQQLLQAAQAAQAQAAQAVQAAQASQQPLLTTSPQQHGHRQHVGSHMNHYTPTEKHHRERPEQSSPSNESVVPAASAASVLNRLTSSNGEITITTTHGPSGVGGVKASPSTLHSPKKEEDDLLNDSSNQPTINEATNNVIDGIDLNEMKEFAKVFKLRRLSLGLTQTQVGQALSVTEGPAYSQSAICSALATQMYAASQIVSQQQATFEKLDITPKSAQKIKPVLARWLDEAEKSSCDSRYKNGMNHLTEFMGAEPAKKRKRRTSFTPQALELLNAHFERNTHPNGTEITTLAHRLGYDREVIRIWFCNKRQSLKNTARMMKGIE